MRPLLEILLMAIATYAVLGIGFALYFSARGVGRVDPLAKDGTLGFRILIFPATVALWPFLLGRLRRGGTPALERNAHRERAQVAERV